MEFDTGAPGSSAGPMTVEFGGVKWTLQTQWLRHTWNPETSPAYPKTGDRIKLFERYGELAPGEYVVRTVEEWEPPFNRDRHGRDIRIGLVGRQGSYNGEHILKAMGRVLVDRRA